MTLFKMIPKQLQFIQSLQRKIKRMKQNASSFFIQCKNNYLLQLEFITTRIFTKVE
jgi:hypothetical protein